MGRTLSLRQWGDPRPERLLRHLQTGGRSIVEHRVFSAKATPPNESGHTQTDGPTQANLSEDTDTNKTIVREYYETVHIAGDHCAIPK